MGNRQTHENGHWGWQRALMSTASEADFLAATWRAATESRALLRLAALLDSPIHARLPVASSGIGARE